MFTCFTKQVISSVVSTEYPHYTAAGCIFVDGGTVLSGVQKQRLVVQGRALPVLSGFGGSREPTDFDWIHTAIRETVEELFEVKVVPIGLVQQLRLALPFKHVTETGGYVMIQYTFDDLATLLRLCGSLRSPLYKAQPKTFLDLITKRDWVKVDCEIGALSLLPLVDGITIDRLFEEDFARIR
jgi:hypothetical protein